MHAASAGKVTWQNCQTTLCEIYFPYGMFAGVYMLMTTETRDVAFPRGRVTGSCECWELNLGPLQEQYRLLTAELPLQILTFISRGWRDCSVVVKGTGCSSRRSRPNSQHLRGTTSSAESDSGIHGFHRHTCGQNTHTHNF